MIGVAGLAAIAGFVAVAAWAMQDVPLADIVSAVQPSVTNPQSGAGRTQDRRPPFLTVNQTADAYPDHLIHAVISIEDRRFYQHAGLDFRGISRALVRNISAGKVVEGGSTITQQLLKIQYLQPGRTVKRKIQEAVLALWIESRLSKDEILKRYLDNVYLGAGATGMREAALVYFDKNVGDLTLTESALLAGLIQAPTRLNPLENLEAARQCSAVVLTTMQDAAYIDASQAKRARGIKLALRGVNPRPATIVAVPARSPVQTKLSAPSLAMHQAASVHRDSANRNPLRAFATDADIDRAFRKPLSSGLMRISSVGS